jgi:8-oxo-dGTP pyrophosphatase MutT (NUDIX family)
MTEPGRWSSVADEPLQDCVVFRVSRRLARSPSSGAVHPFYRIDAAPWVNVVALTRDERVVMVRQWRHGVGALTLEIPGGAVDPGETPAAAAARELLEETGHRAAALEPLGALNPNPALFGNRVHTFLALGCERVAEVQNSGLEETTVELVPRAELARRVRAGEIDHALVVAALHLHQLAGDASR